MSAFNETDVRRAGDGTFATKPAAEADVDLQNEVEPTDSSDPHREDRTASVAAYDEYLAGLREQIARAEQERGRHVLAELALRHPDAVAVHVIDGRAPGRSPQDRSGIDMVSVRRPNAQVQADFADAAEGWGAVDVPNGPDDPWRGFDADVQKAPAARTLDLDKVRAWSAAEAQVDADTIAEGARPNEERHAVAERLTAIGDVVRERNPDARYVDVTVTQPKNRAAGSTNRVGYRSTVSDAGVTLHDAAEQPTDPEAADRHRQHVDKVEAAVARLDDAHEAHWTRAAAPRQGDAGPVRYAARDEQSRQVERDSQGRLTSVRIDLDRDIEGDA